MTRPDYFSFTLPDSFVDEYRNKKPPFGFPDAGNNSVGEVVFARTYSRKKEDGTKEQWYEVCRRVTEGTFTIQKDYCLSNRLPWNGQKALATAKDFYDRLFKLKWSPPGRGLFSMGTYNTIARRSSNSLQNCAAVSTFDMSKHNPAKPFVFLMEASMNGIGVGFDTRGSELNIEVRRPDSYEEYEFVVPDTREGWAESTGKVINAFLANKPLPKFDYSEIRPYGSEIKTFGGTASGPDPLIKLHNKLKEVFESRVGDILDSRLIVDIANLIGVAVVSGNVRRSAELAMGDINDEDFINLKNPDVFPERQSHAFMSNNSVSAKVGDDLSHIVDNIKVSGEPGVIWMDHARNYGRMKDGFDGRDWRAAAFNPSLVAGTRVFTDSGIFDIESLEGQEFKVRNLNGELSNAICWQSGVDEQVYKLTLRGGHSYRATKEHKWPVWDGTSWLKKTTIELEKGDKLPNLNMGTLYPEGSKGTYDEGFLIGWNLGDGWQTTREKGLQIGFIVSDLDRAWGIDSKLEKILSSLGCSATLSDKDEINVNNKNVRELFASYGVKNKSEGLPESVWDSSFSDEYRKGILDGLFSADGTVGTYKVSLNQASKKLLDDVASLLGFFGVKTAVSRLEMSGSRAFPDKQLYREHDRIFVRNTLEIGEVNNIRSFSSLVTLTHGAKQAKIEQYFENGKFNKKPTNWFVEVSSVEEDGQADVWDVSVFDNTHCFQVDHCVTGNCAEQPLEPYECCTLCDVYLHNAESFEDFMQTLKVAFMYGKTVTLLPLEGWPESNAVMQRNRRIGTSLSGVADFVDNYSLPKLRDWLDSGFNEIKRLDRVYSEWLCVRESIRTNTIKPGGTTGVVAGTSPGAHWTPGGKFFIRRVTFDKNDPIVKHFKDANYTVEESYYTPESSVVVEFPIKSGAKRSETEVSIFEKASLAAELQHYWSDNAVSVTVSFDPEKESKYIGTILHMYEGKLKTVSFLPTGGAYKQMPYEPITEEEYEAYKSKLKPVDMSPIYGLSAEDAVGEAYCSTDVCEIKFDKLNMEEAEVEVK